MTLDIRVLNGADLTQAQIDQILALFDVAYDQANHAYLLASFEIMPWMGVALDGDRLAGFAVGDGRLIDLPRMDAPQPVALAGIGCIHPDYRQRGLFSQLALSAICHTGVIGLERRHLFCGRMAHAITYRTLQRTAGATTVPTAGRPLTPWHQEMILRIAQIYGVTVDPETCVVTGKGQAIGYPRLSYEATADEQMLFQNVNRDRGDSLLTIAWQPDAPDGW